mmetsp:Transcript_49343/g.131077  ORF Transcript_49343/g.131077 Transcript_49343/m.131077 type:complete len:251 (+) Transcript_49343:294-1046(+)
MPGLGTNERLHRQQSLHGHVHDAGPHQIHVHAGALEMLVKRREGPLVANVVSVQILILSEIACALVYRVVRQVPEPVRQVLRTGAVRLAREARESLAVDVGAQRVIRSDHHVEAYIELEPLDQQWSGDVLGHHDAIVCRNLRGVPQHEDAAAPRRGAGLHDPEAPGALEARHELVDLLWQAVRLRQEVEGSFAERLRHKAEVHGQPVLAGHLGGARKVVDLLELGQRLVYRIAHAGPRPLDHEVPLRGLD